MSPFCSPAEAAVLDEQAKAASTSVHPEHLSVHEPHTDTPDQRVRFAPWRADRAWLLTELWHLVDSARTRQRIRACGASAFVEYSKSRHAIRIRSTTCGHRLCPACRARRAYLLGKRLELLTDGVPDKALKLVTLTLKHSKRPLLEQVKQLKAHFKRLRASSLWRASHASGVAIIEVVRSEHSGDWHPHLHVLARCAFIPQSKLKAEWWRVTKSSNIVDIRLIRGRAAVGRYVSRYLTKPPDPGVQRSPDLARQWSDALTKTHWVIPFGKRGSLPPLPDDPAPDDWVSLGSLAELANARVPFRDPDWALELLANSLNHHIIDMIDPQAHANEELDL